MEKQPVITQEEFRQQYNERKPHYERLAANLQEVLKSFLAEKSIPYLEVLARVKDVDSAYEKISRKEYDKPFEQIEDWCGLRVICYYPSDIDRIGDMLGEEFDIRTQEDTAKRLASHEFGYRSTHFILTIKPEWSAAPNYRLLQGYKAEVQVRTILMHAWAEIEHKLSYKSAEQVPDQFRRKLFRLSAKFEEADEQFEELRNGIKEYRASIIREVTDAPAFSTQDLNLDTLQLFLNVAFPERDPATSEGLSQLLTEIIKFKFTMQDIVDAYNDLKLASPNQIIPPELVSATFNQAGALRGVMDIALDKYFNSRRRTMSADSEWVAKINEGRVLLGKPTITI